MKNSEKRKTMLNLIAFIALIAIAISQVFKILSVTNILHVSGGILFNIIDTLTLVCSAIVIGVCAYRFANANGKASRIVFWVCLVIILTAIILIWVFNK